MNLAKLSIHRPVLVSCLFLVILAAGILSYFRLTTELYPNVKFPVVNVIIPFPGAAPEEIENQISKPLENALSGIAGMRSIRSTNIQGAGIVTSVFNMDSDVRFAEQSVIQVLARTRGEFPSGIQEPSVRTIDPSDFPLMSLTLQANLSEDQLYDLADREIRPLIERLPQVALVEMKGARKREIQVKVDRRLLSAHEMSMGEVVQRVGMSGMNIPSGQIEGKTQDKLVRSVGQFDSLKSIEVIPIRFVGNEKTITLREVSEVTDGLSDERNRVYVDGKRALSLEIYRQAGGDMLTIKDHLQELLPQINQQFRGKIPDFNLAMVHDGTKPIQEGVNEARLSIEIGVVLTILVVFFFLGTFRSTFITGIALPNSLLGAFLLMYIAGFSINITTLAALSLAVGLLIDDAIVVRESIFRQIENGLSAHEAAQKGTEEVVLAVVATTLTVLSVFGPVAFLRGIIGQFFKEFGLTICFAMLISLLDSLTMAPMLSAHFAGQKHSTIHPWVRGFHRLQDRFEGFYLKTLQRSLRFPFIVMMIASLIFVLSWVAFERIPKSFMPPTGAGEFQVFLKSAPGTSLKGMDDRVTPLDSIVRKYPEVDRTVLTLGGEHEEANEAKMVVVLKNARLRKLSTYEVKEKIRNDLKNFPDLIGNVQDIVEIGGGAGQPYVVHITGQDLTRLKKVSDQLIEELESSHDLKDIDTSYRSGAPEVQIKIDPTRAETLGVSDAEAGQELRLLLAGHSPAHFHSKGEQYDIRVRLKEDQRDLQRDFAQLLVPNLNHRLVHLSMVARSIPAESPSTIQRENRKRFIEISGDINPQGKGLAHALQITQNFFTQNKNSLPVEVGYELAGQTKDFQDLMSSMVLAVGLSIGCMYFVLASLYESFFLPLTIMLVLPLAICGAFFGLFLTGTPIEMNSIIGCILLMGVAAKNSILLVDHIHESIVRGASLSNAILEAGRVRFRPILMTSFALIAGMLPVAVPLNEAGQQRAGMAIAVIGGLVTSTLLTLIVVPAGYRYIQAFENFLLEKTGLRPRKPSRS